MQVICLDWTSTQVRARASDWILGDVAHVGTDECLEGGGILSVIGAVLQDLVAHDAEVVLELGLPWRTREIGVKARNAQPGQEGEDRHHDQKLDDREPRSIANAPHLAMEYVPIEASVHPPPIIRPARSAPP